jgi:hypothetical protein
VLAYVLEMKEAQRTYLDIMRTWEEMCRLEAGKVISNNWEAGYKAARVTSTRTISIGFCLQKISYKG